MCVSQVIFNGITHESYVDQLVTSMVPLADSNMMTKLYRHNWEVKHLQQWAYLLATPTISFLGRLYTVKLQFHRITHADSSRQ